MHDSSPYRKIAVASTFSPRFKQVLARQSAFGALFVRRSSSDLRGEGDEETAKKFRDALSQLQLPLTQRFIMKKEALQKLFWALWP